MVEKTSEAALQNIVDAIARIRIKTQDISFSAFEEDWERRWVIERGTEIISEASRRLSEELKSQYPEIPWKKIAGVGNILRHDYDSISPRVLWNISRNDLIELEKVCWKELIKITGKT